VAAFTAPAEPGSAAPSDEEEEEEEEGDWTSLDLPGRPQAMEALDSDTLQRYLLGISNSDRAQMSLLSVEQFLQTSKGRCTTQWTIS